jgi:hypothetical protein
MESANDLTIVGTDPDMTVIALAHRQAYQGYRD